MQSSNIPENGEIHVICLDTTAVCLLIYCVVVQTAIKYRLVMEEGGPEKHWRRMFCVYMAHG